MYQCVPVCTYVMYIMHVHVPATGTWTCVMYIAHVHTVTLPIYSRVLASCSSLPSCRWRHDGTGLHVPASLLYIGETVFRVSDGVDVIPVLVPGTGTSTRSHQYRHVHGTLARMLYIVYASSVRSRLELFCSDLPSAAPSKKVPKREPD